MLTSTCNQHHTESQTADLLIPLIRAAATIGFAVAPCSLGFVIIAVSEQLIRSIMVGDDPEMLMSDLQNQFPYDAFEVSDKCEGLVAEVVDLIDRPEQTVQLPLDIRGTEFQMRVWNERKRALLEREAMSTATPRAARALYIRFKNQGAV
jgi:hypothetical protein